MKTDLFYCDCCGKELRIHEGATVYVRAPIKIRNAAEWITHIIKGVKLDESEKIHLCEKCNAVFDMYEKKIIADYENMMLDVRRMVGVEEDPSQN